MYFVVCSVDFTLSEFAKLSNSKRKNRYLLFENVRCFFREQEKLYSEVVESAILFSDVSSPLSDHRRCPLYVIRDNVCGHILDFLVVTQI